MLEKPSSMKFCIVIHQMCKSYAKTPCYYLFNGLKEDCKHTRLRIDMAVYNQFSKAKEREYKKMMQKSKR